MPGEQGPSHVPVLPGPVMELLSPEPGQVVADVTVGLGGHARMLAGAVGSAGLLIGLDVDRSSLAMAERALADAPCRVVLECCDFVDFDRALDQAGVSGVDVLFADLGLSSAQMDDPMRGFSFQHDGPLDMRLSERLSKTAGDLVNGLREEQLGDLIYHNSQERFSRRIAKRICYVRRDRRIRTTLELVGIVCSALHVDPRSRKSKIHPATRVFQALRIAVNDELNALSKLLEKAPDRLNPGARIGVISFHSLEDGIVKRDFRERKKQGLYEVITKRPVIAEPDERRANPRSRSSKFRVARRTAVEKRMEQ